MLRKALLPIVAAAALGGCATYGDYGYAASRGGYYGGRDVYGDYRGYESAGYNRLGYDRFGRYGYYDRYGRFIEVRQGGYYGGYGYPGGYYGGYGYPGGYYGGYGYPGGYYGRYGYPPRYYYPNQQPRPPVSPCLLYTSPSPRD